MVIEYRILLAVEQPFSGGRVSICAQLRTLKGWWKNFSIFHFIPFKM